MRITGTLGTLGSLILSLAACSSESSEPPFPSGTSGASTTGGSVGSGGSPSTGGSSAGGVGGRAATGGSTGTGGNAPTTTGGRTNTGTGGTSAGAPATGGRASGGASTGGANNAGSSGNSGATGTSGNGSGGSADGGKGGSGGGSVGTTEKFSFFVTSLGGMRRLSGKDDGFGGDLRYGEATGLAGADKICTELAESSMPGAGQKTWRAFLSTTTVNAVDRIGDGPWYDRLGRLLAQTKEALINTRPEGGDPTIASDLPNEEGTPNHLDGSPGCTGNACPDNHDTLTGSKADGTWDGESTCDDWTSTEADGQPRVGHSWPAQSGMSWIQAHSAGGCGAGVQLEQKGGAMGVPTVGAGGGYGGFYCFALTP